MSGWGPANAARQDSAEAKRARLVTALVFARSFKEAAWHTGIPIRTATRLLPPGER